MKKTITGGLLAILLAGGLPSAANAQNEGKIDEIRTTITNWVELRRTIASRANDWRVEKELIQHRIGLFKEEIDSLQERIDEVKTGADEAQRKRTEFQRDEERLREAAKGVESNIPLYESKIRELSKYFPTPLAEKVSTLMSNMPAEGARTNLGPTQRMALIVGILNEVDKFNNTITPQNELREIEGRQIQVTTVYAGLAKAYYADESGMYAGVGTPGSDGWVWVERNDIAPAIAQAVGVAAGTTKPAVFVNIPIEVTSIPQVR